MLLVARRLRYVVPIGTWNEEPSRSTNFGAGGDK